MAQPSAPSTCVAVDTEFATNDGAPHLVELAAVRFSEGEAVDHFESLICPEVPIAPEASDVHGILEEDVRTAPGASQVLSAFRDWLGSDPLIAHDVRADAFALAIEYARHRLAPPEVALFDSLALVRKAFPELADHRLATVAEALELETDGMHRALFDATLCWQVVEAAVERLGGFGDDQEARLAELCGTRLSFEKTTPGRPNRRPSIVRALERASTEEASVRLLYGEGASPANLTVRPRWVYQVKKRGFLEAECGSSGLLKTYRLDRVQKVLAAD